MALGHDRRKSYEREIVYLLRRKKALGSLHILQSASGFSQTPGKYAQEKTELGGIWGGMEAVCIFGDGSGEIVELDEQYKAMKDVKGSKIDLFKYQGKVNMVNPRRGN